MASDITTSAKRALGLLDLTSLNDTDTEATVEKLCAKATIKFGTVAAVCIWPRFTSVAKRKLGDSAIHLAVVNNFPAGSPNAKDAARDARTAIDAGADEIDTVLPYRAFLDGDKKAARDLVAAVREACGNRARLKVILETCVLATSANVAEASALAIDAGADFIKTSTGKLQFGATPDGSRAMLETLRDSKSAGRKLGFKAAGGVRTLQQAEYYIGLADGILGAGWATPATFRIGASGLLDDLLKHLGAAPAPAGTTSTN
jgi:deoxyribose-phosphate aldolase